MQFIDLRKPNMTHMYYVYVHADEGDEKAVALLYRVGSIMELKRKMRNLNRKNA